MEKSDAYRKGSVGKKWDGGAPGGGPGGGGGGGSGPRGPPRGGLDNVRGLDSIRGRDHSKSKLSARFFGQIFNLPFLFSFPNAFIPFNFQVHCLPVVPAVADC